MPDQIDALRREWEARQQQVESLQTRRYFVGASGDEAAQYNYAALLGAATMDAEAAFAQYREAMKVSWAQK